MVVVCLNYTEVEVYVPFNLTQFRFSFGGLKVWNDLRAEVGAAPRHLFVCERLTICLFVTQPIKDCNLLPLIFPLTLVRA
jgi:hypothetical protein